MSHSRLSCHLARTFALASALALVACQGEITGGPPTDPGGGGADGPRFSRLSHAQWENTVTDLFGLNEPSGLSAQFQPDPPLGRFDNNVARLTVTSGHWRGYQRASESIAELVTNDPSLMANVVPADLPADPAEAARTFVTGFGLRAFRRPLTSTEVDRYAALFAKGPTHYEALDSTTAGVRIVIEAMLQSPHFLYRSELSDEVSNGSVALSGYEVASRLSFALLNTMPDDALMSAAQSGELSTVEGIRAHALRLLDAPRSVAQIDSFHFQAFELLAYADVDKDETLFPTWDQGVGVLMQDETTMFLRSVFQEGSIRDLLTSRTAFVNDELAALYGLEGTYGSELQRVELDPTLRAGFLTRLGFLTRNATLTEPDPIHRGVFINLNLMCRELPALPNLPDSLMPTGDTNRQRVESVTGDGTCGAGCHSETINPLGFALEHYDALGQYRGDDNGFPIDAADSYRFEDGRLIQFDGAVDLSTQLADAPEVHRCYVQQLLEYVYGRDLTGADSDLVDTLATLSRDEGLSLKEITVRLVTSRAFRFRAPEGVAP